MPTLRQQNKETYDIEESLGRFEKVVGIFARLYLMFACLWTICYLVGEIFEKMGVG